MPQNSAPVSDAPATARKTLPSTPKTITQTIPDSVTRKGQEMQKRRSRSHGQLPIRSRRSTQQRKNERIPEVLLLTPVVPVKPDANGVASDPYAPLGKAMAVQHSRISHVPYLPKGITDTHATFIKRAGHIVFVTSGPPSKGQTPQVKILESVHAILDKQPHVCTLQVGLDCDMKTLGSVGAYVQSGFRLTEDLKRSAQALLGNRQNTEDRAGPGFLERYLGIR